MTERIAKLCGALSRARVFADIGCDHGYCTKYMLDNGLCERAYISDISAESLKKAETLLREEIAAGRCIPVVADGLDGIREPCDLVLIAGMGGEEIVHILSRVSLPGRFVLQPMKNCEKVRAFLLERGAHIELDITFSEGETRKKFYDLIAGRGSGGDFYTARQLLYGRDNLSGKSEAFVQKLLGEREKLRERSERPLGPEGRKKISEQLKETEEIICEITGTL